MFRRSFYRIILLILAMPSSSVIAQESASPVSKSFDFRNGALGWEAGFADYPPATDDGFYQLQAGLRSLPAELEVDGTGFYIQGSNGSDDLFMFIKRQLNATDGIVAGQTYQVNFTLVFASNEQSGCGGTGGSPGDSVYLKAGASPSEPLALLETVRVLFGYLRMNVDIGSQSQGGIATSVTGTIANGTPCDSAPRKYLSIQRTHQHTTLVNANSRGELWLLVGTDSGFNGFTSLYYERIDVNLIPVNTPPVPVLLTDRDTSRAAALDSVLLKREPFQVVSPKNFFSSDPRTRVNLFAYNLELKEGEGMSAITAHAEDSQQRIHTLPVEAINEVPRFGWITQVTLKLPDELQNAGDVWMSISLRGVASNRALVQID